MNRPSLPTLPPRMIFALAAWLSLAGGCATYSDHMRTARLGMDRGDYGAAVNAVNRVLDVDTAERMPSKWNADTALALLERGAALQAMGRYGDSARDIQAAEQELEMLDIATDEIGRLGSYIYSDSARNYQITPVEKLSLNAMNMLNYLAQGDLSGAAVEARRFTVMRNHLDQTDQLRGGALGSYLAGFVFEQRGEWDRAMRHYEDALAANANLPSLREPVARLAATGAYQGPAIRKFLGPDPSAAEAADAGYDRATGNYVELLIVIQQSRVPHKIPERIPVGAAIGIAGTLITDDPAILARTLHHVVVYPELAPRPDVFLRRPRVAVNGKSAAPDLLADLSAEVAGEYEQLRPRIIASAVTRLITRAAAAEGAAYATGQSRGDPLAVLASWIVGATLVALDRPDTRSWSLLPGRVSVLRARVPHGSSTVRVNLGDREVTYQIETYERSLVLPVRI